MNYFKLIIIILCHLASQHVQANAQLAPNLNHASLPIKQAAQSVSLSEAIKQAQQFDPWLQGNRLNQQAIKANSQGINTLPAPTVSLNLMNLPTDSFNVNQESMTQIKVGVNQVLPRGNTLALQQSQLQIEASQYPFMRHNRKAQIEALVTQIWLDAHLAQQVINLINKNMILFEQMTEIAKATYSSTAGKTRQQDVIQAQLEQLQLDDRLITQQQQLAVANAQLNEWLSTPQTLQPFSASHQQPSIKLTGSKWLSDFSFKPQVLAQQLQNHPVIIINKIKQKMAQKTIQIAKAQYKPQWGFNASYAYRADQTEFENRADLLSIGVSFDLPFLIQSSTDKNVDAHTIQAEALKTEQQLLLREMLSQVSQELAKLKRLSMRQALFKDHLLSQTHEQAEAALTAYTHDDGRFSDVVRARITQLDTQISSLQLDIEVLKTIARINYYFVDSTFLSAKLSAEAAGE